MERIQTITPGSLPQSIQTGNCGECPTSCQSACKTSCGVVNLPCERKK